MNTDPFQHDFVETNGVTLHVVSAGPKDGPLLLFLHGFPECWMGWEKQIEHFSRLGYRVLAPDQRGYNLSEKPESIQAYCLDELVRDVAGLIQWAGREKAFVVGHDWGAAVSWWLAVKLPERVEKLVILNVPHPSVMKKNLSSNARQILRSWYIFFFQLPRLPEKYLSLRQALGLFESLAKTRAFSRDVLQYYREAWNRPGALRSMVNWYRAGLRFPPSRAKDRRVTVPALIIWGVKDRYLGKEMATQSTKYCDNVRLEFIADASHWVQHERPERVNALIQSFLAPQG